MGVAIGLSTNDAEEPARANLAAHSILEYFDFIAGYDSGYGAKPGTGMQEAFLAQARLEASDVAMVGDSLHDLISGRDAGMRTIAVLSGPATEAELLPFADIVLPDIGHIPDLMKR